MQQLLLELGAPLVIAFVLLAVAKLVRGIIEKFRETGPQGDAERKEDHAE
jgi:hypothetical protein